MTHEQNFCLPACPKISQNLTDHFKPKFYTLVSVLVQVNWNVQWHVFGSWFSHHALLIVKTKVLFGIFWNFWCLNICIPTVRQVGADDSCTAIIGFKMFKRHGMKHKTVMWGHNIVFHPTHRNFSGFSAIILTRISIILIIVSHASKHKCVINCEHNIAIVADSITLI